MRRGIDVSAAWLVLFEALVRLGADPEALWALAALLISAGASPDYFAAGPAKLAGPPGALALPRAG